MKRKAQKLYECVSSCTRSKKQKLCDTIVYNHKYISATRVKNFILNDTLVDWLSEHSSSSSSSSSR